MEHGLAKFMGHARSWDCSAIYLCSALREPPPVRLHVTYLDGLPASGKSAMLQGAGYLGNHHGYNTLAMVTSLTSYQVHAP